MDAAWIPEPFRADIEKALNAPRSFGIKEARLFGSWTSDTWREVSDIDLAVTGIAPETYLKAFAIASRGQKHELDLVDLDHERSLAAFLKETDRLVRIV